MSDLIKPVELKIKRANEKFLIIKEAIMKWLSNNQITLRHEYCDNNCCFQLIVNDFKKPPLDEWSLDIGELIHNLRSSLDYLAFALARKVCDPTPNPRSIAFPICDDEMYYKSKKNIKFINQVTKEMAELIEAFQPYKHNTKFQKRTAENDLLLMLQKINDFDKHRLPLDVYLVPENININGEFHIDNADILSEKTTINTGPIYPNMVIMESRSEKPFEEKMKLQVSYQAFISLLIDGKPYEIIEILSKLGTQTSIVIDYFRKFFEEK